MIQVSRGYYYCSYRGCRPLPIDQRQGGGERERCEEGFSVSVSLPATRNVTALTASVKRLRGRETNVNNQGRKIDVGQ